jgi:hypothetical protein
MTLPPPLFPFIKSSVTGRTKRELLAPRLTGSARSKRRTLLPQQSNVLASIAQSAQLAAIGQGERVVNGSGPAKLRYRGAKGRTLWLLVL